MMATATSILVDLEKEKDPLTRTLRKGDLVRVSELGIRKSKRLNDKEKSLGRVMNIVVHSINSEGDCNEAAMPTTLYEIEWILEGSRLQACEREDLRWTSADDEGMTDNHMACRQRNKRKPVEFMKEQISTQQQTLSTATLPSKKIVKKAKAPREVPVATAAAASTTTKKRKKPITGKTEKSSSNSCAGTTKKQRKEESHEKASGMMTLNDATAITTTLSPTTQLDLYDRHRREFERFFTRLKERIDVFRHFWETAPPEFDEHYLKNDADPGITETPATPTTTNSAAAAPAETTQPLDVTSASPLSATASKKPTKSVSPYPSNAPYNWEIIRRRMEHGRYILDRRQKEEEERYRLFAAYYASTGRRRGGRKKKAESDARVQNKRGVHWELFRTDVFAMCDAALRRVAPTSDDDEGQRGTLSYTVKKIKETVQQAVDRTGKRHEAEMDNVDDRHKYSFALQRGNTEPAMQGTWRKIPFPERRYEKLTADVVCDGLSTIDERIAEFERNTSLPDRFIGQAYHYDDTGESETWMRSMIDEAVANDNKTKNYRKKKTTIGPGKETNHQPPEHSAENDVIRAQVAATMQGMLISIQDTVMTSAQVMHQPELKSENWLREQQEQAKEDVTAISADIVEQPVWGIDCYTRRNISYCLEIEFDASIALRFIEKWLLPAINACPKELAHDIGNAARILMDIPVLRNVDDANIDWTQNALGKALKRKISTAGTVWLKPCASELLRARNALGLDFFRVHPKGHGSVVLASSIPANRLVTFYHGELYPSWRWGEKMDAIEITQKRKKLKPALPDFYNMILERPHLDPRGYGILFVDATRKGGHGSSLSHSCDPTCEVRVASKNGKLCLVMTTLRQLEMGEELTFDYNAVTESLNEYRSAVCLCGYGKCRGSFLHFATADCYQQVLNRNSPIAARFANLVRGSMKQIMSIEDTNTLVRHGFSTAAFGAISVNRRQSDGGGESTKLADSLNVVPVWLRTYVAETLRYIEYERRALPIALMCDNLSGSNDREQRDTDSTKEPQPESSFVYFSRTQHTLLSKALTEQGFPESMNRFKRMHAMKKVASAYWAGVSEDKRNYWDEQAKKDYKKKLNAWKAGQKLSTKQDTSKRKSLGTEELLRKSKMSIQNADGESVAAMEQRIQQLTQSLSRVGRVLDRHREIKLVCGQGKELDIQNEEELRTAVHAPLRFLTDAEVIDWMWNSPDGLIQSLHRSLQLCEITRPQLLQSFLEIRIKYDPFFKNEKILMEIPEGCSNSPSSSRHELNRALLDFRTSILEELKSMSKDYKSVQNDQKSSRATSMINSVPASDDESENTGVVCLDKSELCFQIDIKNTVSVTQPWIDRYGRRFVLQAAADVLLMYANTSTFFLLQPYETLESSPVKIYARELGNSVPRSAIDDNLDKSDDVDKAREVNGDCAPEDIVSSVSVRYQGDYVLSQLLQWYNAGIGQPPGLPDLMGCAVLPRISDCFESELVKELKAKSDRKTFYEAKVVPALVSWLQDPYQRGNAWPALIQRAFNGPELRDLLKNSKGRFLPLGSPVVDFLVTGNESNITAIVKELDSSEKMVGSSKFDTPMLTSVDKGRPAQAVSTWIQCELCQKWRRVPWHVDRDTLPEKFACSDNKWNASSQSCDSPEDDWDAADALVGDDGKMEGTPVKKEKDEKRNVCEEESFWIGARFDVLRSDQKSYCVATVSKVDFSGSAKRIMFHFADSSSDPDEWIPFGSCRIAPLHSKLPESNKALNRDCHAMAKWISDGASPKALSSFYIGARFDVFRNEKKRFFKAVVKDTDNRCTPMKILFHFLKTSANADEWVEYGSDRIRPYKSAAPVTTKGQKHRRLENQAKSIPTTVTIDSMSNSNEDAVTENSSAGPSIGPVHLVSVEQPIAKREEPASISSCDGVDLASCQQQMECDMPAAPSQPQQTENISCQVRSYSPLPLSQGQELSLLPLLPYPVKSASMPTNCIQSENHMHPVMSIHFKQPTIPVLNENSSSCRSFGDDPHDNHIGNHHASNQSNLPHHATGYRPLQTDPETLVHQFSAVPMGMPNSTYYRAVGRDTAVTYQYEAQKHQMPQQLSGLDVLAMLTEGLEVVTEQQPNLSPEQALHQYIRSQMQHFPR